MKVTRTVTIDGSNKAEYEQIKAHMEKLQVDFPGCNINFEPLINRVTAIQLSEVESL